MAFRFPLEAVYRFRQGLEHQHELRLRTANQQVARARHLAEQLDHRIGEVRSNQDRQLAGGTTSAELRFALFSEGTLRQLRRELEQEILRLEAVRDQQQKIFRQARRERETIESLRQRQLREYERARNRSEQRELDDLFLLRQAYLRHG